MWFKTQAIKQFDKNDSFQVCLYFHFYSGPYDDIDEKYRKSDDFDENLYGHLQQTCFTGKICKLDG